MKRLYIVFIVPLFLVLFSSLAKETSATYSAGYGWAKRIDNGIGQENELKWEFYNVAGNAVNPTNMTLALRDANDPTHVISRSCSTSAACSAASFRTFKEMDGLIDGDWVHESYIYVSSSLLVAINPGYTKATYSGDIKRIQRVYLVNPTQQSSPQIKIDQSTQRPVEGRWYNFLPSDSGFFQATVNPTLNVGGTLAPLVAGNQAQLKQNSTVAGPTPAPTTFSYPDSSIDTISDGLKTAKNGYVKYLDNGAESSQFAAFDFGVDRQPPTASCTVTANNLKGTGPYYTTDETLGVIVTGTDPGAPTTGSGVLKGDIDLKKSAIITDTGLPNSGYLGPAEPPGYNDPTSFPFTYTVTDLNALYQFRYKTWDKTYDSSGVQGSVSTLNQSSWGYCPPFAIIVSPHVDLEVTSVELFSNSARTALILAGTKLAEGQIVWPRVTYKNSGAADFVPPSPAPTIGFYINSQNQPISGSPAPDFTTTIPPLIAGQTAPSWDVNGSTGITVPSSGGIFNIYPNSWVDNGDSIVEDKDDNNYLHNVSGNWVSQAYPLGVDKFFESRGGDVGAVDRIATGVKSSDPSRLPGSLAYYQSDYLLAAGDLPDSGSTTEFAATKVSPAGFKLDSFSGSNNKLVAFSSGVYDYFASKFRSRATPFSGCTSGSITGGSVSISGLNKCPDGTNVQITGNITVSSTGVLFVDGDLDIRGNITATGTNAIVFVVNGNIIANHKYTSTARIVTELDGIYIAKKTFYDHGNVSGFDGTKGAALGDRLHVDGSVYADGIGVTTAFDLSRYFVGSYDDNVKNPSDEFFFDPKYLIVLNSLLASPAVGWGEVGP